MLAFLIGPSEAEVFWIDFLKKLKGRNLKGVKLMIHDVDEGQSAIRISGLARLMSDGGATR
jgi:putative transposase